MGKAPMEPIHRYLPSFTAHFLSTNSIYFHLTSLIPLVLWIFQTGSKGEISMQAPFPGKGPFSFRDPRALGSAMRTTY